MFSNDKSNRKEKCMIYKNIIKYFIYFVFITTFTYFMATTTFGADSKITYSGMPVPSAMAPSISAFSSDMCRAGVSGGANTGVISLSGGATIVDPTCEIIRLSKALHDFGLKVAAVSLMCADSRVFEAMLQSGSPCPVKGAISEAAYEAWYELKPEVFHKLYGDNFTLNGKERSKDEVQIDSSVRTFPYME